MRRVTLSRRKGQTYGFHLSGGTEHGTGFFITKVEDGSIAQKEGIKAGDELLEVGGRGVKGATHRQVTEVIGVSTTVSLVLRSSGVLPVRVRNGDPLTWRPVTRSPTDVSQTSALKSNLKSFSSDMKASNPSVTIMTNGPQKTLPGRKPSKLNSCLAVDTPHTMPSSLVRSDGSSAGRLRSQGVMPRKKPSSSVGVSQGPGHDKDPNHTRDLVERILRVVIPSAGKSSLGFSMTHDRGVAAVATVRRGGPAWCSGLRQHDVILACNGRPIASMTHEQAVAEMKKDQAAITLEVKRLVEVDRIAGESSGYNSSASSTTGDQASPTTTTAPRRRRPNLRGSRDLVSSRANQARQRARQLELQRIEGHWAAAEEAEERRRRVPHHVTRSHSASDLLDAGLYNPHSSNGALSASVSSLTAVGADSSADDHDSSGCEGTLLTPSTASHVSNIVVSCGEEDAISRLDRLSVGEEPQLELVDLQLQRIREHQLQLARRERELLTEKSIYEERRQLQLDRSSPRSSASVLSPSDSDTLYSHCSPSNASSYSSTATSSCGKHTSRILIKACPPPPPLRQENVLESQGPPHTGGASCDCCKSRGCRGTHQGPVRTSPPSSPSSSSGVSCSSVTRFCSGHPEDSGHHWGSTESKSPLELHSSHCRTSYADQDKPYTYDKSPQASQQRSKIPAPPIPNGLPIIPRPPPLKMGDDASSTTSSISNISGSTTASDAHRTNFAAALSDVVSKRNAKLSEDDLQDDGARAQAYEAKIEAYKREKAANSKKLQHEMLMEEFKRKHKKMFDGEERARPVSPVASTTTTEVMFFGPGNATTAPKSIIVSTASGAQSTVVSPASGTQSSIVSATVKPQNASKNTAARPQSTVLSNATKPQSTSVIRPKSTIIIGPSSTTESSSTLLPPAKKTPPLRQQGKSTEIVEKNDPFASKIVTRSATSSVGTQGDVQQKTVTTSSGQKNIRVDVDGGANNVDEDSNSALNFWKKKEVALKTPAEKPKGKAPVQATKSFSGLKIVDQVPSSSSVESNGVFPVTLRKTAVETIVEDVNDEPENSSTSQLIKTFNSIASAAPKNSSVNGRPKSVVITSSQGKGTGASNSSKTATTIAMKPISTIDRTPRLVSQQVSSKYTIIPPPPSSSSDKFHMSSSNSKKISSNSTSRSQSTSSNTSKVYVSVNGDSIDSHSYSSNNIINGINSELETDFHELSFPEPFRPPSPLSTSANLNFSIRNVSPTELIIPEPPSSSAEFIPEIPKGVPPPPPTCGDSWSERYERRLSIGDDVPPPARATQVTSEYKNLFRDADSAQSKPNISFSTYKPS